MKRYLEWGGIAASMVLIAFGIGAIVIGVNGRSTVHSSSTQEAIVGSPDMNPAAIAAEAKEAGLPASIELPTDRHRRQGDQHRLSRTCLRQLHAHPRTRGEWRTDLRADAALRDG